MNYRFFPVAGVREQKRDPWPSMIMDLYPKKVVLRARYSALLHLGSHNVAESLLQE
jgi:hypothetical protein